MQSQQVPHKLSMLHHIIGYGFFTGCGYFLSIDMTRSEGYLFLTPISTVVSESVVCYNKIHHY